MGSTISETFTIICLGFEYFSLDAFNMEEVKMAYQGKG